MQASRIAGEMLQAQASLDHRYSICRKPAARVRCISELHVKLALALKSGLCSRGLIRAQQ